MALVIQLLASQPICNRLVRLLLRVERTHTQAAGQVEHSGKQRYYDNRQSGYGRS